MKVDYYIKKYLKGDGLAFDMIYELTKKDVYLSIYLYVKDRMIIEDLMQDVYITVIEKLSYYNLNTNFHAWISKIARNKTINYINKSNKEVILDGEDQVFNQSSNHEIKLDYILSHLEGIEREVFVYRIYLGHKFKDIESTLNLEKNQSYYIFKKAVEKVKRFI